MFYFIAWIVAAMILGGRGEQRTCGYWKAFFCSLLFTPILAAIYVFGCDKLTDVEFKKQMTKDSALQKLKDATELHEKGVISDEDFENAKKEYQKIKSQFTADKQADSKKGGSSTTINPIKNILKY